MDHRSCADAGASTNREEILLDIQIYNQGFLGITYAL